MALLTDQDLAYLKGVGPNRAELLRNELGLYTFGDLLFLFPYKYIDRSRIYKIAEIDSTLTHIQLKGKISGFRTEGQKYRKRLIATFFDDTGTIELVWFQGIKWIASNVDSQIEYIVFGRPAVFNRAISIAHPEIEPCQRESDVPSSPFSAQYSTTEKLKANYITSRTLQKLIATLVPMVTEKMEETLPAYLVEKLSLMPLPLALREMHMPTGPRNLERAQYRIKFEELFYINLGILRLKHNRNTTVKGYLFSKVGDYLNHFYKNNLPFELTNAQKRVIKEIRRDLGSGKQMNRLLQGDVGSGKTLVALMAMLIAIDNGYQACLMAPTEILAHQHYSTIVKLLVGLGIEVRLLTGSVKKKERTPIYEGLASGSIPIIVGTHALIEDTVSFASLGLVIIDEQHRFGVAQRARLWGKSGQCPPHILVMTATPIPRTLAMTIYGDLDMSVIDEMPPGRQPVKTYHYYDSKRLAMFGFLEKQIAEGRQIFVVYPMIKESESLDYKYLEDGYEGFSRQFPPPRYIVTCLHGRMKGQEKEEAMQLFASGKSNILIATTVIEVGVDVPNASVMVIESADRFGLSQLHQLRGRVGRGASQSYCILMTSNKLGDDARKRLQTMVATTDGFEIAEVDMQLRGPGDLEGTQQSGMPFNLRLANLGRDSQLVQFSRTVAEEILKEDPGLSAPNNRVLAGQLARLKKEMANWAAIS